MKKLVIIILILLYTVPSWGWENKTTHRALTFYAAHRYFDPIDPYFLSQSLTLEGVPQSAELWLEYGAEHEDDGTFLQFLNGTARSINHFHDPTITNPTKTTLETAGLSDLANGMSAIKWAQTGAYQNEMGWPDWSWQKVRQYQYNYLTAVNQMDQDANLARTLKGLGYQMHLLQDMSQPAHVRNNTHIIDGSGNGGSTFGDFETWAANNGIWNIPNIANYPDVTVDLTAKFDDTHNLAPVARLSDTRTYLGMNLPTMSLSQGLAEYTNGNFFSKDTIFAAERFADDTSYKYYFPYPRKDGTNMQAYFDGTISLSAIGEEDGKTITTTYISKIGDNNQIEQVDHLAREGNFTALIFKIFGEGKFFYSSFAQDEQCFNEYATKLLPRTVSYNAAMLKYFYRGKLAVSPPDQRVYGIIDGSILPQQFTSIKAKVQNVTPKEAISFGSLIAVASFKIDPNSAPDLANYPPDLNLMGNLPYYSISMPVSISTAQMATINSAPTEFTFDFSQTPIPAGITDLKINIVFQGTLGNEAANAVAQGQINISGPTHQVFWNLSDMFSLNNNLYTADQIASDHTLYDQLTDPSKINPYNMDIEIDYTGDDYIDTSRPALVTANVPPGRHIRIISLFDLSLANYADVYFTDPTDGDYLAGENITMPAAVIGSNQPVTPIVQFRYWENGGTQVPFIQHFKTGALNCQPFYGDFCSYPVQQALPAEKAPSSVESIGLP